MSESIAGGTKRGKFQRVSWEFDVVLNSRQQEIEKQKRNGRVIDVYINSLHVLFSTIISKL